jgi:hypothetical protein
MTQNKQTRLRWQELKPWFFAAFGLGLVGAALLVAGMVMLGLGHATMAEALIPVGVMFSATSVAPLILGFLHLIDSPVAKNQHCGRCRFYQPSEETYSRGKCGFIELPHLTTSDASCAHFQFSERAMVRERLNAAPEVLNSSREA